jgi:hypothetical protein
MVLIDDERELVISEVFRSFEIIASTTTSYPGQELDEFLSRANFPNHKLIVGPVTTAVAHDCPSRQRNIERVAGLLATRVSQLCPECQRPFIGKSRDALSVNTRN